MARNPAPSAQRQVVPQGDIGGFVQRPIGASPVPSMRGGSAGIIPSQAPKVSGQQGRVVASAAREERAGAPVSHRYRVMNGGYCVFNGFKTPMAAGKIVEDTQYDVVGLRAQGLVLEEIDPPPVAVVEDEPEEAAAATA